MSQTPFLPQSSLLEISRHSLGAVLALILSWLGKSKRKLTHHSDRLMHTDIAYVIALLQYFQYPLLAADETAGGYFRSQTQGEREKKYCTSAPFNNGIENHLST